VKTALASFCKTRKVFGIVDTGIIPTVAGTSTWRSNTFQENTYFCSIFGQALSIFDHYTMTSIPVTSTYFLAGKIPAVDRDYGIQYPFVGPNRGTLTGFESLNFNPNEMEKEELYKARVNYIEQDEKSTKFNSQLTSQFAMSALSSINNVRVLLEIIRQVEELAERYYHEFAVDVINSFQNELNNILSDWVNNKACTTCTGTVYQTAYDAELKTARVKVEIVFNNTVERIILEFNIGK
jgi:hypothetical protein